MGQADQGENFQMTQQDSLYVFSHLPKTAGFHFKSSIEKLNPKQKSLLASFTYAQGFANLHSGKREYYKGKEHFTAYVGSLNQRQVDQIQYVLGHDAYYGIHQLLRKHAHYITFIREPVSRTLSLYNYECMHWSILENIIKPNPNQLMYRDRLTKHFLIDGKIPDFETWLHTIYRRNHIFYYSMTDYLAYLQFIDKERDEQSIQNALKKFSFVGLTDTFDTDSAYLYQLFNVKYPHEDENRSHQLVKRNTLSMKMIQEIRDMNFDDMLLYECAQRQNASFKNNTKDFYVKVNQTHFNMKLYYPFKRLQIMLKNMIRPWAKPIKEKIFK